MPNTDPYGGFTIPERLHVDALSFAGDSVTIHASTDNPAPRCPCCEQPSRRVHGRYTRTLSDLPWGGVPVRLRVRVRKFFCEEPSCERKIFAERLEEVARPFARGTERQREALEWIAFALGGEAGARLARELGLLVSPDTLLNPIREASFSEGEDVRVVGVERLRLQKGQRLRNHPGGPGAPSGGGPVRGALGRIHSTMAQATPERRGGQPRPLERLPGGHSKRRFRRPPGRGPLAPPAQPRPGTRGVPAAQTARAREGRRAPNGRRGGRGGTAARLHRQRRFDPVRPFGEAVRERRGISPEAPRAPRRAVEGDKAPAPGGGERQGHRRVGWHQPEHRLSL